MFRTVALTIYRVAVKHESIIEQISNMPGNRCSIQKESLDRLLVLKFGLAQRD